MGKKKYKEYKKYHCPYCLKDFGNRKDNCDAHINKKNPCKPKAENTEVLQNPPELLQIPPEPEPQPEKVEVEQVVEPEFQCEYCLQSFAKKFNLDRHLKDRCKEKKKQDEANKDNQTLNLILEQIGELKKENKELKETIDKKISKKKNNVNINIVNNTQTNNVNNVNNDVNVNNNINNNIINFNDFSYEGIDKKLFIQPILNPLLYGKAIILQMIENIYINENLPQHQNIIITDKNRGYVKVFNNGRWKTDDIQTINLVLNGIITHSKTILQELRQRLVNNNQAQSRLNTSKKYIDLCDLEFLDDLEDEQTNGDVDNSYLINRCKNFRGMVFKDTINLFHDNKNILIKPKKLKNS